MTALGEFEVLNRDKSKTFSTDNCPQDGSEEQAFKYHYGRLISKWEKLKQEY